MRSIIGVNNENDVSLFGYHILDGGGFYGDAVHRFGDMVVGCDRWRRAAGGVRLGVACLFATVGLP
jgi:hypothetical protein